MEFLFLEILLGMQNVAAPGNIGGRIESGLLTIQLVLSSLVVIVGICVALFNVLTKLPSLSDPHEKNQFWKTQGWIIGGVAFGAICVWLIPWVYNLFT